MKRRNRPDPLQEKATAPPAAPPADYITVKEAAFRLGKSTDCIYNWLRTGRLKAIQPGGRCCTVLVDAASVSEALRCRYPYARELTSASLPHDPAAVEKIGGSPHPVNGSGNLQQSPGEAPSRTAGRVGCGNRFQGDPGGGGAAARRRCRSEGEGGNGARLRRPLRRHGGRAEAALRGGNIGTAAEPSQQ